MELGCSCRHHGLSKEADFSQNGSVTEGFWRVDVEHHFCLKKGAYFSLSLFFATLCSMQDLCSPARDRTHAPALGVWSFNHWTAWEAPIYIYFYHPYYTPGKMPDVCRCNSTNSSHQPWEGATNTHSHFTERKQFRLDCLPKVIQLISDKSRVGTQGPWWD